MTIKDKIILGLLALVVSFAAGRFTATKPNVTTQTVTNEDKDIKKDVNDEKVTTITEKSTGEKQTTIVEKKTTSVVTDDKIASKTDTKVVNSQQTTSIVGMVGIDYHTKERAYGLGVSHDFVGPVSLGVFGFTNGVIGVSIGVRF